MNHYRYIDYSLGPVIATIKQMTRGGMPWSDGPYNDVHTGELVFECDAPSIVEADQLLKAATGIVAAKEFMIGCSWTP